MDASPNSNGSRTDERLSVVALLRARSEALGAWRRRLLALAAGCVSVLAMAPFFLFPVLFVTLPLLVWLIDAPVPQYAGKGRRWDTIVAHPVWHAALLGWWFAFGYFFAGLFWIGEAFLVEAELYAMLIPLVVTAMPAGLALFWAAAAAATRAPVATSAERVLLLALGLAAAEYLRGHVFTGFPWNVLGYALTWPLPLMQNAAYLGIYGLTLAAVLIFALPLVLWAEAEAGRLGSYARRGALAVALIPLGVMTALGAWRMSAGPPPDLPGVRLRIVQPSVPQREKWRPEHQERIFREHVALSRTSPTGAVDDLAGITHVIWPEAAMPFLPLEYPQVSRMIGEMLPGRTQLIAGALRAENNDPGSVPVRRIFNSILVFGQGGIHVASYDKIHLVPFGEYLPFKLLLEAIGLKQLVRVRGGLEAGESPRPLMGLEGLPLFTPLVCYEAIFPGALVQGEGRPGLLLNVTNDGWFGNTTGPRQHYHQARVRAVEEGLSLVRAANNGISAVFDPHGRVVTWLGLDAKGTIDAGVPAALPPPPYARFGDAVFFTLWLALAAALIVRRLPIAKRGR